MTSNLSPSRPYLPNPFPYHLPSTPVYGVAMTCLLSCAILTVFFTMQIVGVALFAPSILPPAQTKDWQQMLAIGSQHGTVMGLMVAFTFVVVLATVATLIKLKKGSRIGDYLALKPVEKSLVWKGIGALLLLNGVIQAWTTWLGIEPMDFLDNMYATAHPLWLLVLGMVVLAPIYEEVMFRGFMWVGLANSRLGFWGASAITSLVFAMIHMQYQAVELVAIVALAMLFSWARAKSGSLLLPMMLHIINNGLAMGLYLAGK